MDLEVARAVERRVVILIETAGRSMENSVAGKGHHQSNAITLSNKRARTAAKARLSFFLLPPADRQRK
jgi:hypothetical protein